MNTRGVALVAVLGAVLTVTAFVRGQGPAGEAAPVIAYAYDGRMAFGVVSVKDRKRLTFSPSGTTNTTVVRIDGQTAQLGATTGKWAERGAKLPDAPGGEARQRTRSVWVSGHVTFTQTLEIIAGEQPAAGKGGGRRFDTLLVRYLIENRDSKPHRAGLRLQLDTMIGGNDGVPFTVPGLPGLVNTFRDLRGAQVPAFLQALEVADLARPGTVAHMTLRPGRGLEPPDRVSLTRWPGSSLAWDIPMQAMGSDSAVVLYWDERPLGPGEQRACGFAYGLGTVSSAGAGAGRLGLALGGSFEAGGEFTVTAYVKGAAPGHTLRLELPADLERAAGKETEPIPAATSAKEPSILTWKVKALRPGDYTVRVRSSAGLEQSHSVRIHGRLAPPVVTPPVVTPTGGQLAALTLSGPLARGQVFTVTATVKAPLPGQHLTLTVPPGLARLEGTDRLAVPHVPAGESTVAWKVKAEQAGTFTIQVQSSTGAAESKSLTIPGMKTGLNVLDARRALQMSVGNLPEESSYDMDSDGRVTSLDAAIILQQVLDQTRKGK